MTDFITAVPADVPAIAVAALDSHPTTHTTNDDEIIFQAINENGFGGQVIGADVLSLSADQLREVNRKFLEHKVLVFRNQRHVNVDQLRTFSQQFGILHSHILKKMHHEEHADVNVVANYGERRNQPGPHNEDYHSDLSW
jgi:alpha-ketoglutarate-dependent taurine dioxygenase